MARRFARACRAYRSWLYWRLLACRSANVQYLRGVLDILVVSVSLRAGLPLALRLPADDALALLEAHPDDPSTSALHALSKLYEVIVEGFIVIGHRASPNVQFVTPLSGFFRLPTSCTSPRFMSSRRRGITLDRWIPVCCFISASVRSPNCL